MCDTVNVPSPIVIFLISRHVISMYGGIKLDSALYSIVENHRDPASFKEADTGKYVVHNASGARLMGVQDPKDLLGLTVRDVTFLQTGWGVEFANIVAELDFRAIEKKIPVSGSHPFLHAGGNAQFEEVIKIPVLGHKKNVLGIITSRNDLTDRLSCSEVYELYRRFYAAPEAIRRVLAYLGITQCFTIPPTEAPLRILLAKTQPYTNKEIGRLLGISHRTVDYQFSALRNKVVNGDVHRVLTLLKQRRT